VLVGTVLLGAGEDRSDPILFAQVSGPARAQCLGLLLAVVMVLRVASGGNCSCASVCFVTDNVTVSIKALLLMF